MKFEFRPSTFSSVIGSIFDRVSVLEDGEYTLTLEKKKRQRSLNANAYFWVMVGKIAEKSRISRAEVYRQLIKDIGGNYDVVCVQNKAVDSLINGWEHNGLGWCADRLDSKIDGCTNVALYYGSSTYDTEQMSRLLDLTINECKDLGIDVMSDREKTLLLADWGK